MGSCILNDDWKQLQMASSKGKSIEKFFLSIK